MKDIELYKNIILCLLISFLISCASPGGVPGGSELTPQEEAEFLNEEDEEELDFEAELERPETEFQASSDAQPIQEEEAAESELEDIEDEFAEFVEDEEDEIIEEDTPEEIDEIVAEPEEAVAEIVAEEETGEEIIDVEEADIEVDVVADTDQGIEESIAETPTAVGGLDFSITDIRYDQGQIFIDTAGGEVSYRSRFNESTKQLILEFPQTTIVDQLKWPFIMKEFQSSDFALLQADQKSDNVVRIVVQMRSNSASPNIIQRDDQTGFIISGSVVDLTTEEIMAQSEIEEGAELDGGDLPEADMTVSENFPSEDLEIEGNIDVEGGIDGQILTAQTVYDFLLNEHKFYGNRITINIRNANLKEIIYFLAEDTELNMIVSDKIPNKKVDLLLKNIPWDQVLITLMKQNNLAYVRKGNIITIAPLADFESEIAKMEDLKRKQEASAPLNLEIIPISYAKVGQIRSQIEIFKSIKGKIQIDTDNNSLVVYDTTEALEKMKALIKQLDRTPKQVMIAAKIVEVSDNFSRNFGVNWGFNSGSPVSFSLGSGGSLQLSSTTPLSFLSGSSPDAGTLGSHLRIGTFKFFGDLDARFGIAETEGTVRVLSSPRIMALNGKSASVTQGTENISISGVVGEGGVITNTVQRSPVNLTLNVTPDITNVNSIYMRVSMTRSFEGAPVGQGQARAAPTNTRQAQTEILVKSGQTAVIGGIYETQETESLLGFPFLKYIPMVKWLFSQTNTDKLKTELLLFLTPRIVDTENSSVDVASSSM